MCISFASTASKRSVNNNALKYSYAVSVVLALECLVVCTLRVEAD
jgi:hypothetical protein